MHDGGKNTGEADANGTGPVKKPRVYKETAKVRHTTHWDMDYLPLKEVDALYAKADDSPAPAAKEKARPDSERLGRYFRRLPLWLVLLAVVLLFGRFVITLAFHLLAK